MVRVRVRVGVRVRADLVQFVHLDFERVHPRVVQLHLQSMECPPASTVQSMECH